MKAVKKPKIRVNVMDKNFPSIATSLARTAVNTKPSRIKNVTSVEGLREATILNGCMFIIIIENARSITIP